MPLPEKAFIERIRRRVRPGQHVVRGIGDDCALLRLPRGHEALVTTDFTLEGIHFRQEWHPADSVGHRCLARGLSDIAAMAGEPIAAFLSLAVPRHLSQRWIDSFFEGLLRLAKRHRATLAGGDVAESPSGVFTDIVVLGSVPAGTAVLRSGARPGDWIYVTGQLGESAAALEQLLSGRKKKLNPIAYSRHFYPQPRVELARLLRQKKIASAMIDISDGLSTDLAHICEESHVGAEIEAAAIPRARVGSDRRAVDLELALHGGEDYELLFTAPVAKRVPARIAGVPITRIGRILRRRGIRMLTANGTVEKTSPRGWEHLAR